MLLAGYGRSQGAAACDMLLEGLVEHDADRPCSPSKMMRALTLLVE